MEAAADHQGDLHPALDTDTVAGFRNLHGKVFLERTCLDRQTDRHRLTVLPHLVVGYCLGDSGDAQLSHILGDTMAVEFQTAPPIDYRRIELDRVRQQIEATERLKRWASATHMSLTERLGYIQDVTEHLRKLRELEARIVIRDAV